MSLYIATLDEMKSELGISDNQDDTILTRAMEGLQARFESHLDRVLLRASGAIEIFDGWRAPLLLRRFPVESVAGIHVSANQVWTDETLEPADNYVLHQERGAVLHKSMAAVIDAPQSVRVVYTGGFVAAGSTAGSGQTAMPEDLRRAFFMQLSFEFRNRTMLGKTNVGAQGVSIQIAPAKFLADVLDTLQPLRRFI